jgi:tetratricopeptide (TPR) repeat protein
MAKQQEPTKVQVQEFDIDAFKNNAISTFEKYKKIIYGLLVGLVLLIGGLYVYFFMYMGPREKRAEEEIFRAEYYFGVDSFSLALSGRNQPGQQGNFTGLLDFITEFKGTSAAKRASFMAGAALLHTGKYQDAVKYLSSFSSKDKLIQAQAYGMLGDAKSELNEMDEALKYYLKAADHYPNDLTSPIQLRKAALLYSDVKKNNAEALKLLERIKKEYPKTAERIYVDKDIARLGGK